MFNKNLKNGFSLVEMLVAVAVFMMVVTVAMGALMSIINPNRKARAIQSVVSNVNFVIESISKDIRMGNDYYCGTKQQVKDCSSGGSDSVNYISPYSIDRVYYHFTSPTESTTGKGYLSKCSSNDNNSCNSNPGSHNYSPITSPDVNVLSLKFYVVRHEGVQPKVVIIMEGEAGSMTNIKSKFSLQTTASQRLMKE